MAGGQHLDRPETNEPQVPRPHPRRHVPDRPDLVTSRWAWLFSSAAGALVQAIGVHGKDVAAQAPHSHLPPEWFGPSRTGVLAHTSRPSRAAASGRWLALSSVSFPAARLDGCFGPARSRRQSAQLDPLRSYRSCNRRPKPALRCAAELAVSPTAAMPLLPDEVQ